APVLDVRHRRCAPDPREAERDPERDPEDDRDREPEADALEAGQDVGAELGEEPEPAELDQDRRRPRELRIVGRHRPQLPAGEHRDRHRDLGGDLRAPVEAWAHRAAVLRCEACQRSTRCSARETAKWIATPSSPVATAYAYSWSRIPNE